MRILIAEDDGRLLKSLKHILELNKFSVDGVDNGVDALEYAGSGVYDGYGHFIGMVIAADEEHTLAIPMERINTVYREIAGKVRDTQDYS